MSDPLFATRRLENLFAGSPAFWRDDVVRALFKF